MGVPRYQPGSISAITPRDDGALRFGFRIRKISRLRPTSSDNLFRSARSGLAVDVSLPSDNQRTRDAHIPSISCTRKSF
jgi:hypothetical protein